MATWNSELARRGGTKGQAARIYLRRAEIVYLCLRANQKPSHLEWWPDMLVDHLTRIKLCLRAVMRRRVNAGGGSYPSPATISISGGDEPEARPRSFATRLVLPTLHQIEGLVGPNAEEPPRSRNAMVAPGTTAAGRTI